MKKANKNIKIIERYENDLLNEKLEEGRKEGKEETIEMLTLNLIEAGSDDLFIAKVTKLPIEIIKSYRKSQKKFEIFKKSRIQEI